MLCCTKTTTGGDSYCRAGLLAVVCGVIGERHCYNCIVSTRVRCWQGMRVGGGVPSSRSQLLHQPAGNRFSDDAGTVSVALPGPVVPAGKRLELPDVDDTNASVAECDWHLVLTRSRSRCVACGNGRQLSQLCGYPALCQSSLCGAVRAAPTCCRRAHATCARAHGRCRASACVVEGAGLTAAHIHVTHSAMCVAVCAAATRWRHAQTLCACDHTRGGVVDDGR